jgi:hypothetical protein
MRTTIIFADRRRAMRFPSYVHSVVSTAEEAAWPVEGQGENECGCTSASNALNLLVRDMRFRKDDFVREAGLFFQRSLGGTPSPTTGRLIQRHGFGTHFGNLSRTDFEAVLRDLIDRGVPAIVEIGLDPLGIYGGHSIVLVGYSDPYRDAAGRLREEWYFVDSQFPALGQFALAANDMDVDGDGRPEVFPGNRTIAREEFRQIYPKKIYYPVFPTQADHDAWYRQHIRPAPSVPVLGWLTNSLLTGSYDLWVGPSRQPAPLPS